MIGLLENPGTAVLPKCSIETYDNGLEISLITLISAPANLGQLELPVSRYSHEKFWPSCPQN
jgi:hypothetical protein